MKRLLVMSDMHCGHFVGLTPPGWQERVGPNIPKAVAARGKLQRALWKWFEQAVKAVQPIDVLVVNGDAIDGKGKRSGSTELRTADLGEQAEMAAASIRTVQAEAIHMVYGTPYHVDADGEDIERYIATEVGASIEGHAFVEVEGVVFDCKHKVGGSQVPHGRHTAASKERLWNLIWAERKGAPRADVIIRSHVHYFQYSGGAGRPGRPNELQVTTPALQGPGSKYGVRQCSGTVDFGFLTFDCHNGGYSWQSHLLQVLPGIPAPHKH